MQYDHQAIVQLQADEGMPRVLETISRDLHAKNSSRSSRYMFDVTSNNPVLVHQDGANRQLAGLRCRIYLVAHGNGKLVANRTPEELAHAIKYILQESGVQKIVLMACYGLIPPAYSQVPHDIGRDFAEMFMRALGTQVTSLVAYGAMTGVKKDGSGHKIVTFDKMNWVAAGQAEGVKKTFFWKDGVLKVKTAVPVTKPVNDTIGLGNDSPDAMDIDG
jgi:hypothetical protein